MDVLVHSIDVNDLFPSSSTLDPTTPLSAPDLRLLIDRLELRSQHIKSRVHHYLLSHQKNFVDLFSLCSDSASRSESLSRDVSDLLRLFSDRPIDVEIRNTVVEIGENVKDLRIKREILELVRVLVGLSDEFISVKDMVKKGNLVVAANKIKELKVSVRIGDDDDDLNGNKEPVVYGLLKKQWFHCFEEIQDVLLNFMENVVLFEQKADRVRVKYQLNIDAIEGVELHTVLEALDVLGILDHGLAKVADLMIKFVITPTINCTTPISFVEQSSEDSDKNADVILKMLPSDDDTEVVPDDASKLADFQKIVKITSEFENSLKEMMLISASGTDNQLSDFAENVEVHFASRKKTELLAKARNILLECNFTVPQVYTMKGSVSKNETIPESSCYSVADLLFLSERCVISEAASQLMKLVHRILQDVCMSTPRVGLEFYHAARDALLLYEAVIPIKLDRHLDSVNQVAVVMHNDCLYLSQEILGLAFEYRPDFPSSIKEWAMFVDLAPKLQLMAEEILQRQIHLVCLNLKEAMDGADGFQNTHQMQQYESAKFCIDQVVFILEKVHIIWEPLLLPSTYEKCMCMVLESALSRISSDILLLDDIAADETLQLQRLIQFLLENLSSLLASLIGLNKEGNSLIPSLHKIHKLEDLLDMPLKSITSAWERGELVSCGFTLSEMEDFIRAIFTDSPLRKESLRKIKSRSF